MTPLNLSQHLTSEQMDGLLFAHDAGRDEAAALHLKACPACSAELAELRSSLGVFREATTELAERRRPRQNLLSSRPTSARDGFRSVPAYFALAASLAVTAVIVPLVRPLRKPEAPVPIKVSEPAVAPDDDALLMEIDQQLDASVPAVMEPLADPTGNHRKHAAPETTDTKED